MNKKVLAVIVFAIALIADILVPGSGIVIDLLYLLWELTKVDSSE